MCRSQKVWPQNSAVVTWYAVIGFKLKQNANDGCNSCASLTGLVLLYCMFYFTCDRSLSVVAVGCFALQSVRQTVCLATSTPTASTCAANVNSATLLVMTRNRATVSVLNRKYHDVFENIKNIEKYHDIFDMYWILSIF